MGNTPGALEALRAANTALTSAENNGLSPLTIAIQIDMADALLRLSLSDEAAACMQLASRTEDEAQLRRLADLAYRFNFWQEALRILERNVSLRPESGSAALAVADIAAKSWQLDRRKPPSPARRPLAASRKPPSPSSGAPLQASWATPMPP